MKSSVKNRRGSFKPAFSPDHADIILNSIAAGVFTVDKGMRISYFNHAAEEITGVSSQEALGQYCTDILRSSLCENNCPLRFTLKTGKETSDKPANFLRSDGKQIPVSLTTAVLRDKHGRIVGGVESFKDLSTVEELKKELKRAYTFEDIVSKNHKILELFDCLPNIAQSGSTVLLQGPSGSGKELFARAIHNLSPRKNKPFVAINCGALPDTLLDSELFGYVKGAFTDAKRDKPGRFTMAQGGTIFLDEVESLSLPTQVRLLRVLQEREFEPVGATTPVQIDVRVIAATKDELSQLMEEKKFRDDLYFRLNVVRLQLPPLDERRDDIPLLINHFIDKFNRKMAKNIIAVSGEVMGILMQADFPGNVRQLENIIEHAFVMCQDEIIEPRHLPLEFTTGKGDSTNRNNDSVPTSLEEGERQALLKVLERNGWNKAMAAKELRLHRTSLWRKLKKHGLAKPQTDKISK